MFRKLQEINRRPAPFERYTAEELWTDEHSSSRMLACHLDGEIDLSSRKTEFIDRSACWITSRFDLNEKRSVADFGCGPGLYTIRLATSGADVTGIDFSARSIRYAREQAESQNLSIDYVQANYLELETAKRFDLITLIMCDFCALSPDQRRTLLGTFLTHLKPGGHLLLDVYSLRAFDDREETAHYARDLLDGFWSPEPYFGFLNTFKYEQEKVVLDKYTLVEEAKTRVIYNWLQYYDRPTLQSELESSGLEVVEILGDVAGAPFDAKGSELALVATKPG